MAYGRQLRFAVGSTLIFAWVAACRAEVKADLRNGRSAEPATQQEPPPPPVPATPTPSTSKAEPIEIGGGLAATRRHFQTRSTVELATSLAIAQSGSVSLYDDTTSQVLIGLLLDAPTDEDAGSGGRTRLRFYPAALLNSGLFAYGANALRLVVDDTEQPKFAQSTVYLRDFPAFAPQGAFFADGPVRQGGFEGELPSVSGGVVDNGSETLTTGLVPIVSW
jgi:hypothetical protein